MLLYMTITRTMYHVAYFQWASLSDKMCMLFWKLDLEICDIGIPGKRTRKLMLQLIGSTLLQSIKQTVFSCNVKFVACAEVK